MKKPVLFLIFNRPDVTNIVFETIRLYKPNKLYIAADGPRKNISSEIQLCEETRKIVNNINWDCEVKTLFRNENLGCKLAVAGALNWFFDYEEDGIILEDDVVPNIDFFNFCEFSLNKYKDENRIMMITGHNHLSNNDFISSYFFSKLYSIWGWATWKRAWKLYDIDMKKWDDKQVKKDIKYSTNKNYIWKNYKYTFDSLKTYYIDTWDIQWSFTCLINNGLCVTPKVNLITNIGVVGTHSKIITDCHFLKAYSLDNPINYTLPETFITNSLYDEEYYKLRIKYANRRYFFINILIKLKLYKFVKSVKKLIKF
jgi:hypothetical protein